jgi:hypothetical protein
LIKFETILNLNYFDSNFEKSVPGPIRCGAEREQARPSRFAGGQRFNGERSIHLAVGDFVVFGLWCLARVRPNELLEMR